MYEPVCHEMLVGKENYATLNGPRKVWTRVIIFVKKISKKCRDFFQKWPLSLHRSKIAKLLYMALVLPVLKISQK